MILTQEVSNPPVEIELTGAIVVDGRIRTAGEVVTVEYLTWLNLKARDKAVLSVGKSD